MGASVESFSILSLNWLSILRKQIIAYNSFPSFESFWIWRSRAVWQPLHFGKPLFCLKACIHYSKSLFGFYQTLTSLFMEGQTLIVWSELVLIQHDCKCLPAQSLVWITVYHCDESHQDHKVYCCRRLIAYCSYYEPILTSPFYQELEHVKFHLHLFPPDFSTRDPKIHRSKWLWSVRTFS